MKRRARRGGTKKRAPARRGHGTGETRGGREHVPRFWGEHKASDSLKGK